MQIGLINIEEDTNIEEDPLKELCPIFLIVEKSHEKNKSNKKPSDYL